MKNNNKLPSGSFYFYQICYICNSLEGIIVESGVKNEYKLSIKAFLNEICLKNYRTFDSVVSAIKKKVGIKTNIPIYINERLIFFQTVNNRRYDVVFLNYFMIDHYYEKSKKTMVIFKNNHEIIIDISVNKFRKLLENVNKVIEEIQNC